MATKVNIKIESHVDIAKKELAYAIQQWANEVGMEMVNLTHRDAPSRSNRALNGRGTPVDTGYLRNSMAYAVGGESAHTITKSASYTDDAGEKSGSYSGVADDDNRGKTSVHIGSNVVYAPRIEEGGQGYGGQHMLRNAVMDVQDFAKEFLVFVLEASK